jgi:REP element-mobilizing transposase RayT
MRYENFTSNEHYHVFGRGIDNKKIFIDDRDKARFIFLITHFQSPIRIYNVSWYTERFIKKGIFNTRENLVDNIIKKRDTELIGFALVPNNFHLLIRNINDGILSVYMHRILTAYSKYFNSKYKKKGHVFEGPFKAIHIKKSEDALQYLSDYIQKDPKIFVKRSFRTVGFAEPFVSFIP